MPSDAIPDLYPSFIPNYHTQPLAPVQHLQSGAEHNCFIYSIDSKIVCWGNNKYFQTEVPRPLRDTKNYQSQAVGIATGGWHTCILEQIYKSANNNYLSCWGRCSDGQCHIDKMNTKDRNIMYNNKVDKGKGQIGEGEDEDEDSDVTELQNAIRKLNRDKLIKMFDEYNDFYRNYKNYRGTYHLYMANDIIQITAGNLHTCALTTKKKCVCFGLGEDGQTEVPVEGKDINSIFNTIDDKSDDLDSINKNKRYKQELISLIDKNKHKKPSQTNSIILGVSKNKKQKSKKTEIYLPFDLIKAGWSHTCGKSSSNQILCWGLNHFGQSDAPDSHTLELHSLAAGMAHSCALLSDYVHCWGSNQFGQLAPQYNTYDSLFEAASVSCGARHTLSTQLGGGMRCWGSNDMGQCNTPRGYEQGAIGVAAGYWHTCGIRYKTDTFKGEYILCWGSDEYYKSDWYADSDNERNSYTQYSKMLDEVEDYEEWEELKKEFN